MCSAALARLEAPGSSTCETCYAGVTLQKEPLLRLPQGELASQVGHNLPGTCNCVLLISHFAAGCKVVTEYKNPIWLLRLQTMRPLVTQKWHLARFPISSCAAAKLQTTPV